MKRLLLVLAICAPISLVGCGGANPTTATTPAPPNSPQTQLINVTKTLADSINAAVKTAIALEMQGKLSHANTVLVMNWSKTAANMDEAIATELGSADTWPTQKARILVLLPMFRIPAISGLDPTMQASLSAVQTLVSQIQSQVLQ